MDSRSSNLYLDWLVQLTGVPTASGRERLVIAWITDWVQRHNRRGPTIHIEPDRFGNLILTAPDAFPPATPRGGRPPVFITAHLDHPAFVVTRQRGPRHVEAHFRGGVHESFFRNTPVTLHSDAVDPQHGRVIGYQQPRPPTLDPLVVIELDQPGRAAAADLATWKLPAPRIKGQLLHAPACDDLAGVAAALCAFDATIRLLARRRGKRRTAPDLRLLFTRAEEVGFVGAIAATRTGLIPRKSRLICLENSRSYAESPLGGGPIVRVGDRTSTFDPDLTYAISAIAQRLAAHDRSFIFQRRLMPGGTCEATAFGALGYASTCLCCALGNYHNMNESTGRIAPEFINTRDYLGLVRLLVETATTLDEPDQTPPLKARLDHRFRTRRHLLK